ncbi:MAG TPA: hypothetical protein VF175_18770 [Lacipirellula sp.]
MARCFGLLSACSLAFNFMLVALNASVIAAQEFRIETEVYVGDEEEPASHTVTLFEKSAVYEFIDNPKQIIVYNKNAEGENAQFILLDPATRQRTDIDVDRVEKLMEKLTRWAAAQKDPTLQFAAAPSFTEKFDEEGQRLTLSSPQWTYRVATFKTEDSAAIARYHDFTNRFTELNAMLYNSPPPGPRMALNAALEKHGVVPVEIQRITGGDEDNAVKATHLFSWRLSRDDRARLDEAQKFLANFEKVDNREFVTSRMEKDHAVVRGQSQ